MVVLIFMKFIKQKMESMSVLVLLNLNFMPNYSKYVLLSVILFHCFNNYFKRDWDWTKMKVCHTKWTKVNGIQWKSNLKKSSLPKLVMNGLQSLMELMRKSKNKKTNNDWIINYYYRCVAPVLEMNETHTHPHNIARSLMATPQV